MSDPIPTGGVACKSALLARLPFGEVPAPLYLFEIESRRIVAINDAAVQQYGYTCEELVGMKADELRPAEDVPGFLAELRKAGANYRKRGRWTHRRKDGTRFQVDVRSHEVLVAGTRCLAVMALDITDQLRAEREQELAIDAMRKSEANFRTLFERAGIGMAVHTIGGTLVASNPALREMLGYADHPPQLELEQIVHPDDLAGARESVRQLVDGTVKRTRADRRFLHADGSVRWSRATLSLIPDPAGGDDRVLVVVEDVTELRLLEDQFRQAQKMEAVGRLAGGVAHDFNNILTTIIGNTELVLADLPNHDALRVDIEEIRKAADRAAVLTRQLLAFSRKQVLRPELIDLGRLLSDIDRMLRRIVSEDVQLSTDAPSGLGFVYADRSQVEQVIMNLVVNARDAMTGCGTLSIGLRELHQATPAVRSHVQVPAGKYVVLSVRDTGCGIPADLLERIFEPFFTTKDASRGTGLGLATVYGIVKQSGGFIWVQSVVGEGSTFEIQLPVAGEAAGSLSSVAETDASVIRGTETVLLVEDEASVRQIGLRILRRAGYTVLEAANGGEALLIARNSPRLDILVTDLVMPRMSGFSLAEELKGLRPDLRVLFMSGYSEDAASGNVPLDPAAAFLEKPFTAPALTGAVRRTLDCPNPSREEP
ncbi:MAG TPA: PAS domain S-box protein [Longimicrobiales bacterium]|nr:PAS domain S-box protein [Longimicrobiales bacterium]